MVGRSRVAISNLLRILDLPDDAVIVDGDSAHLDRVVTNLLSNAVKFTDAGAVTLRLKAWPEEPGGWSLLMEVVDTGAGMTREQMARLFTPFDQTADGVSAQHGGSGLGLSISRDLIELMGGRLTARSAPGQGARFTVWLPLCERAGAGAGDDPAGRHDLAGRGAEAMGRGADRIRLGP